MQFSDNEGSSFREREREIRLSKHSDQRVYGNLSHHLPSRSAFPLMMADAGKGKWMGGGLNPPFPYHGTGGFPVCGAEPGSPNGRLYNNAAFTAVC